MNKKIKLLSVYLLVIAMVLMASGCTKNLPTSGKGNTVANKETVDKTTEYDDEKTGDTSEADKESQEDSSQSTKEESIEETTESLVEDTTNETEDKSTEAPTKESVEKPTEAPTQAPTVKPTQAPTVKPTQAPTVKPTQAPTQAPTVKPTQAPTQTPTVKPTQAPTPTTTAGTPYQPGGSNGTYEELVELSNVKDTDVAKVRAIIPTIITNEMTDVYKIKAVHDFLVKNTSYDNAYYTKADSHDHLENILVEQRAVCQGYSVAFYVFMKELGIPCSIMTGVANSGKGAVEHAWNAVKVDGSWYFVDVTWDDPTMTATGHNTYPDGSNMSYEYLFTTFDRIGLTHTSEDFVGTEPTPYGATMKYNDEMYMTTGINGIYRINSLDTVTQVTQGITGTSTYVFIIEGGAFTTNDVMDTFVNGIKAASLSGGISSSMSEKTIEITFTKKQ